MGTHPIFESDFDCLTEFGMGISRDSLHKRRATGGKRPQTRKKRAYEAGRPSAMTRLMPHRVHLVRTRGQPRRSAERSVLLMSFITHQTTNWFVPRPWSKALLSPLIQHHSVSGTNLIMPPPWPERRTPSSPRRKNKLSTAKSFHLPRKNMKSDKSWPQLLQI